MFDRLKKAFFKDTPADSRAGAQSSVSAGVQSQVSQWAGMQGLAYSSRGEGRGFAVEGMVSGKPWRMERGRPSRDFIRGEELRARAELGVRDDVAVLIMNRHLKEELEKRAFSLYTDTLQTQIDPHLPEEMRWLSMYEEVGWEELGQAFLDQYAILADARVHATQWIKPELVNLLQAWPSREPSVPRVLMVLRGKVYLRMQINEGDIPSLEHASRVFTTACNAALLSFSSR